MNKVMEKVVNNLNPQKSSLMIIYLSIRSDCLVALNSTKILQYFFQNF